jgi:pyrimidine-specific ribonucleoside hydrolase
MDLFRGTIRSAIVLSGVFVVLGAAGVYGHGLRPSVIIDTDMALDDARAIVLLAASDQVDIRVIVTSDGCSGPIAAADNVSRLLHALGLKGIPVGAGVALDAPAPPWRSMSEALGWSDLPTVPHDSAWPTAESILIDALSRQETPLTYICLGPLTNLADLYHDSPELLQDRVEAVHVQGSPLDDSILSWNTARDTLAARTVLNSALPLNFVNLDDTAYLRFDRDMLTTAGGCGTVYCRTVARLHQDDRVQQLVEAGHFRCWDESVIQLFLDSDLGKFSEWDQGAGIRVVSSWNKDRAREQYAEYLSVDREKPEMNRRLVVFGPSAFEAKMLQEDVTAIAEETIARHGNEEWASILLTNEFHRHLGIY